MNKFDNIIDDSGKDMEVGPKSPTLKKPPMPTRQQADLVKLDNALVISDGGVITFRGFELSGAGVEFKDNAREKDMMDLLKILVRLQDRAKMLIADALAQSDHAGWGNVAKHAETLGIEAKTMSNAISAMRGVAFSLRREVLSSYNLDEFEPSVSHYMVLQGLDKADQRKYLHATMQDKLSVSKLYKRIHGKTQASKRDYFQITRDDINAAVVRGKKFTNKQREVIISDLEKALKELRGE